MAIFPIETNIYWQLFLSICLFLLVFMVSCSPPEDPIKCSSDNSTCNITNSYGMFPDRSVCKVADVSYPTSEQELISIVLGAAIAKRKVKVATRFSHSIPKLVCPDGADGLLISTKYLNKTLKIDPQAMTITVESGVTLRQIIEDASGKGLALPYTPYWWGVTIGGLMGTGSHGSSLFGNGSSVHDHVVELRIVSPGNAEDGFGRVRVLNETHEDFQAAKVSLGVLGVISQVTLMLQPIFKRSITYEMKNDLSLADEAVSFGRKHEFADITWYPSQGKAIYRIDDRVSSNTSGDGLYDYIPFRSTLQLDLLVARALEETEESSNNATGKCIWAELVPETRIYTAFGLTNNGTNFTGYPVVGFQNRFQSSGTCLDSPQDNLITACPWDPRIKGEFFHQTTFTIGLSVVKNFIEDVQKLVALEPHSLCGVEIYNGILMRYVKASSAFLGKQEDSIDFDFKYYRSKDPMTPRLYEDILEEIEQMAVFKYKGLPHWGKNRNLVFDGVISRYTNATLFLNIKERYDPLALFSSEWTDQILGLRDGVSIMRDGCALEGLCICSQDNHCAPNRDYFCRPDRIYTDAKVCIYINSTMRDSFDVIDEL